jgi:hypothetical protein
MQRGYSRSRRRDEEARAKLRPLAPGERPAAVTVGALVALVLGLVNPLLYALGVEVNGSRPAASGVILYSAILLLVAWGMWRAKYWAVLGMQTLLALALVVFGVFLIVEADSVSDVLISLAVLGAAGTLFWFLVKAMARIQMPQRPGSQPR